MLFLNILVVSSWPDAGDCAGKRQFSGSNEESARAAVVGYPGCVCCL